MPRGGLVSRVLVVGGFALVLHAVAARADTNTSLGDRSGEGSTPFTGLGQTPEANLFTGSLGTSIKIETPAGRKNLTPSLTLQYSSNGGPSPYGFGWDLPLGRIQRSTKWGVPRCDGAHTDDFVLTLPSGAVELIAASPTGSNTYRPTIEESYVVATKMGGNFWTVTDRTGLTYTFGDVQSARVDHTDGCQFTTAWGLTHIQDPNGNTVDITYLSTPDNVLYPSEVRYGGNIHLPQPPHHIYHVVFSYASRTDPAGHADPIRNYLSGAEVTLTRRLTNIAVTTDVPAAQTPVRSYVMTYDTAPNGQNGIHSVLSSVQLLGATGAPVYSMSTTFTHADSATGFGAGSVTPPPGVSALRVVDDSGEVSQTLMDMNGDGLVDIVKIVNSSWTVYTGTGSGFSAGQTWNVPDPNLMVHLRDVDLHHWPCDINQDRGQSCVDRDTMDITGDGIPDFIDAQTAPWHVYPGQPAQPGSGSAGGFSSMFITWNAPSAYIRKDAWEKVGDEPQVVPQELSTFQDLIDMNGDGRPDLVITDPSVPSLTWQVYLNNGTGFDSPPVLFAGPVYPGNTSAMVALSDPDEPHLIDMNGDGLPDYVILGSGDFTDSNGNGADACGNILVYYNTGSGFVSTPASFRIPRGGSYGGSTVDLVDINGDGLPDWVSTVGTPSVWRVLLNQGGSFEPPPLALGPVDVCVYPTRTWQGVSGPLRQTQGNTTIDLFDINGDGILDRVDTTSWSSQQIWTTQVSQNVDLEHARPNALQGMQNALGADTQVSYVPSTSFENTDANGIQTLPFVTWVVSTIIRTDGSCEFPCSETGRELQSTLSYNGGLYDATAREFRGFRSVQNKEDGTENYTQTFYGQDDVTKGKVLQVDTYAFGGQLIHSEVNNWHAAALSSTQSTQLWLAERDSITYDLNPSQTPLFHATLNDPPDAYGNNGHPDAYGNVKHTQETGLFGAAKVDTYVTYATPSNAAVGPYDKPAHTYTIDSANRRYAEKWFFYDSAMSGTEVHLGNVTRVESWLDQSNAVPPGSCTDEGVSTGGCVRTTMVYDSYGNVTSTTDDKSGTTYTHYDDTSGLFLFPHRSVDPLDHTTITETDYRWGKPLSVTDPNDTPQNPVKTQYLYDSAGRLTCVIPPLNSPGTCSRKYAYTYPSSPGQFSSVAVSREEPNQTQAYGPDSGLPDQAAGYVTTTEYFDGLGRHQYAATMRTVNGTDQAIIVGRVDYDNTGRVTARYDDYPSNSGNPGAPDVPNNGSTTYDYQLNGSSVTDPLSRVHTVTTPNAAVVTTLYDRAQRTDIDEMGMKTVTTIDPRGRVVLKQTYAPGSNVVYANTAYTYDGAGRVLTTKQNGNADTTIAITYDSLGRKIEMNDPDSGDWTYAYDGVGNLIFQGDPKTSQHEQFCYDKLNRVTKKYYFTTTDDYQPVGCAVAGDIDYHYDSTANGNNGIGRLTSVTDLSGSTEIAYDQRGRTVSTTKAITLNGTTKSATTSATYNAADQPETTTYPDGEIVTTAYDHSGAPKGLTGDATYVAGVTYDLFGRTKTIIHGNGVIDSREYYGQPGENLAPNGHGLKRLRSDRGSDNYLDLSYPSYNPRGQLLGITDNRNASGVLSNTATYTYDNFERLKGAIGPNLSYAPGTPSGYDYNPLGNMIQKEGMTLAYDSIKPHTLAALTQNGVSTMVDHDPNGNRMGRSAVGASPDQTYAYDRDDHLSTVGTSATSIAYQYDYAGRRVARRRTEAGNVAEWNRYYSELVETEGQNDGLVKSYFIGGLRVATQKSYAPTLAALAPDPIIQLADAGGRPALIFVLRHDVQIGVAVSATVLAVGLLVAPWRRKRVVGLAVRHGHVLMVISAFALTTLPLPVVFRPFGVQSAWAGGGGGGSPPPCGGAGNYLPLHHYHADHLGSTEVVTYADGKLSWSMRYKPYGELRGGWDCNTVPMSGGASSDDQRDFTTYQTESAGAVGLEYAGARFYDPALGMFLTHDPIPVFANPYSYMGGDPINGTDPGGACPICFALIIGLSVGFTLSTIEAA